MSTTTPPPAPSKSRLAKSLDALLDKSFPPGQSVPLSFAPGEYERILEDSWKDLPFQFHFETVNGSLRPRSFEDKRKLACALAKL
jgi:hypothetical protein